MTRKPWDRDRHRSWQLFRSVSVQLADRLDDELQQGHDLALIDYEVLSRLSGAPEHRLRMSDLATEVQVSRSRLTYRIDRLVDVGFVRREECEDDRRGMWAIVTETGQRSYEQARPAHEGSVDDWFFDQIPAADLATFEKSLHRVASKLSLRLGSTG